MKRKKGKIIAVLCLFVLMLTNVSTVFAAWGDPGYTVNADGRWYQWFGVNATSSEKISTASYVPVKKLYSNRDAVVQVDTIQYSYPVCFTVYTYGACAIPDTATVAIKSSSAEALPYYSGALANDKCLGYYLGSKAITSNYVKGLWSPDSYK